MLVLRHMENFRLIIPFTPSHLNTGYGLAFLILRIWNGNWLYQISVVSVIISIIITGIMSE